MTLLKEAVKSWISDLPPELLETTGIFRDQLLEEFPKTYSLYTPMLLLPAHTFHSESWMKILQSTNTSQLNSLYKSVAKAMKVTHIAINAAIPPSNLQPLESTTTSNILRSPTNLQPLYGDFGPPPKTTPTTPQDIATAFWVSCKQNGINQIWAPLYTMFSRGNISEKTRILHLETLQPPILEPEESTAVDLYAGIGYFAFSYVAAGVRKVLCWEINPWSVEGLRRGAGVNRWGVEVVGEGEGVGVDGVGVELGREKRIVVFMESNEEALRRIESLRGALPPVRHVNCGLLPSSRGSWRTAVEALDPEFGGWIHVHQNIAVKDIEEVKSEIVAELCGLVESAEIRRSKSGLIEVERPQKQVECEHVERVKTYAPGVMHCVLDIKIAPRSTTDRKQR